MAVTDETEETEETEWRWKTRFLIIFENFWFFPPPFVSMIILTIIW